MNETAGVSTEMADPVPMQVVDNLILPYHLGHAALLLFVLTVPAGIVKGSRKLLALILITFGGLFLAVPSIESQAGVVYGILGIVLMVVGPVVYTTAER